MYCIGGTVNRYNPVGMEESLMKLSLGTLFAYSAMDVLLTMVGLNLGLRESSPIAVLFTSSIGIVIGLLVHFAITIVLFAAILAALWWVEKHLLRTKYITRTAVSLITVFYIYVLNHNLYMIWRYV